MIGNNFTLQSHSDYNPLFSSISEKACHIEIVENRMNEGLCLASLLLLNELEELGVAPEHHLFHLDKDLSHYSFHFICNKNWIGKTEDDLIASAAELEELEIEPLNIQQFPERATWAVQNQAFVALKHATDKEQVEVKVAPRWAHLIEEGKIKQLNVKDQTGCVKTVIESKEIKITHFTAAELDHISTTIFRAIDIAYQIKNIEQRRKEEAAQKERDQKEMANREKRLREGLLQSRMQGQMKQKSSEIFSVPLLRPKQAKLNQKELDERRMKKRQEKVKEEKQLQAQDDKEQRIKGVELKKDILKREIKQSEIRN